MNYASVEFLAIFPFFCLLFWALRGQRARQIALLIASLAFYAYGEPLGMTLLVGVIATAYAAGLLMERLPGRQPLVVAVTVVVLLADLAFFKYSAFIASALSLPPGVPTSPFLPLGISFFTFEAIAYVLDIKRGVSAPERSLLRLSLFVAVFPHLISGPIMRPGDFLPQMKRRIVWHLPTFVSGLQLFVEGFAKKRLIADTAGLVADAVFAAPSGAGMAGAWIGALAYTAQIYGDFAGYTDMGRGIARMLGFELPLNFSAPYTAVSITDFWRRWHISLSSWLRDYLYIPLGGSRRSDVRTYANLIMTMLLGGLWHGAGWTFVAWGGYHGILLALERRFGWPGRLPAWLSGLITLFLVINGWVLFRAQSFTTFLEMIRTMYIPSSAPSPSLRDAAAGLGAFVIVVGGMLLIRIWPTFAERLRRSSALTGIAYGGATAAVILLAPAATRAFIYFRF